jgi:hypothetical protein
MTTCHDMKKGDIFVCTDCGLELEVIKECKEAGTPAEDCACHVEGNPCTFSCCGQDLVKRAS